MKKIHFLTFLLLVTGLMMARGQGTTPTSNPPQAVNRIGDEPLRLTWLLDSLQSRASVKGFRLPVKKLLFGNNSAAIDPSSTAYLDSLAQTLGKLRRLQFSVDGHTDNTGSAATNTTLSSRRAKAVFDYLKGKGIDPARMSYTGYGPTRPAAPNTTAAGRQRNRRVELTVTRFDLNAPDRITLVDGSVREVGILYKDVKTQVLWVATNPQSAPETWPMKTISSIRTASGTVTNYRPVTEKNNTVPEDKPATEDRKEVVYTSIRRSKKTHFGITAYGNGAYTLTPLAEEWADKAGFGILQGFGGGVEYTHYFGKRIGVLLDLNYTQWKAVKRYMTRERDVMYESHSSLKKYSALLGVKAFLGKGIYLAPQGGGGWFQAHSSNSERHPESNATRSDSRFFIIYGGDLGFEKSLADNLVLDVALQYRAAPNDDFFGVKGPLHYGALKVGIGFKK